MQNQLIELEKIVIEKISKARTKNEVFSINTSILGKNGELSNMMRGLRNLSNEERPKIGALMNKCRDSILSALKEKEIEIDNNELNEKLSKESVDVSIPVHAKKAGTRHLIEIIQKDIINYFVSLGFSLVEGSEVETDHYCFEALNIPKDHPARDAQDSFYFNPEILLRVHTSATQIKTMESQQPPIKMISTGKVYRVDEIDATHSPMFHQLEILVVDKNVNVGDLKGILEGLIKYLFGEKTQIRLRPSFFPFTEPSIEVDASCPYCNGKGCSVCKESGYIELLGAGMVNPKVLENCNIDSSIYTGFAAGLGIERLAMIRYGVTDIRDLFDNEINFLKQIK